MTAASDPDDGATEARTPDRQLLTFRTGGSRCGVWLDEVLEILPPPPLSRLPLGSREVAGVTSVRGDVVPVLDLGIRLFDQPAERPGILLLVRHHDTGTVVGLLVDEVGTLVGVVEGDDVEPTPPAAERALAPAMTRGVVAHQNGVITILDLGRATAPPGIDSNED